MQHLFMKPEVIKEVSTGTVVSLGELLWSEDINCCRKLTFTKPKVQARKKFKETNSKQQDIQMVRKHITRYTDGWIAHTIQEWSDSIYQVIQMVG